MWRFNNPIRHEIPATVWPTRNEAAESLLFQPIRIGPIELTSRTWVPAMVPWRATDDGYVTQDNLDWYERFAEGQPGAIVVEATGVRDIASGPLLRIGHDRYLDGLRKLVDTVKRASHGQTRLFIQIIDFLAVRRRPQPVKFFERFLAVNTTHREALAATTGNESWLDADESQIRSFLVTAPEAVIESVLDERELEALRFGYRERVTDVELEHIRNLPEVLPGIFAQAAVRARKGGL